MDARPQPRVLLFVVFVLGYFSLYFFTIHIASILYESIISESWELLGDSQKVAQQILKYAPLVTPVLGFFIASLWVENHIGFGSRRLGGRRFFFIGLVAFIIANWMILTMALNLFIDREVGEVWIEYLGVERFNFWFFLLAPVLGYIGGMVGSFITIVLLEAQRV